MTTRGSTKSSKTGTKRQQTITLSVRFQCHAIPARWTFSANGRLVYAPARTGLIEVDPWKVRDRFLSLERNNEQLLKFLNEVGSWDLMPSLSAGDYWEWQEVLRTVLSRIGNWREVAVLINRDKAHRSFSVPNHYLALQPPGEFKNAIFSCANHSVLDAIIASVKLDEAKLLRRRPTVLLKKSRGSRKKKNT
jgi:hypothetical protein